MKVRKSSVIMITLLLLLFEIFVIPLKIYNYASYIVALLLGLYVIQTKEYCGKLGYTFLFPLTICATTVLNYGYGNRTVFFAMIFGLTIIEAFYVVSNYINRESFGKLMNLLRAFFVPVMVLNDVFCFLGMQFYGRYYLIGSKFRVVYLHCLVMTLLYPNPRKYKKIRLSLLALYSIIIAQIADCSTGIIAVLLVWIMLMFEDVLVDKVSNVKFIACLWGIVILIYVSLNTILANPTIQYFITNILGEDSSLTGRTRIYSYLTGIIMKKPIWGYGYQSVIVEKVVGFGNAQNGTIKFLIDYGAIGLAAFVILVVLTFYKMSKTSSITKKKAYPFVVLVSVLFVCSIVEVSFNSYMYLALAVIAGLSINADKEGRDG